jgi:hypothetical protein
MSTVMQLTKNQQWVAQEIHRRRFGRIEKLQIKGGDPQINPPPKIVTTWKFMAKDNGSPPDARLGNFVLRDQFLDMFNLFRNIDNGVIETLVFANGMPLTSEIVEGV